MDSLQARLISLVAPAVLVLVASLAVWQATAHDQSSWSGAGFGMFATVDGEATRQVRGHIEQTGRILPIPNELEQVAFEARVLPTEARLYELGEHWRLEAGVDRDEVLVVEVWGLDFERSTGALSRFVIQSVRVGP